MKKLRNVIWLISTIFCAFGLVSCDTNVNNNGQNLGNSENGTDTNNEAEGIEHKYEVIKEGDSNCAHQWYGDSNYIYGTCTEGGVTTTSCRNCNRIIHKTVNPNYHNYDVNNVCVDCGDKINYSTGLEYVEIEQITNLIDYYPTKRNWNHDTPGGLSIYSGYLVSGIGSCNDKDIVIPSVHAGRAVLGIADSAFYANEFIKSVTLSQYNQYIGDSAFAYCINLQNVNLNKNITAINKKAFYCCQKLNSIYLPSNLGFLGEDAFAESGIINNRNYQKNDLIVVNSCVIDGKQCKNKKVEIGDKITCIGEAAFENNLYIEELSIKGEDTYLWSNCFYGCSNLKKVKLSYKEQYGKPYYARTEPFANSGVEEVECNIDALPYFYSTANCIKSLKILNGVPVETTSFGRFQYFGDLESLYLYGPLSDDFDLHNEFKSSSNDDAVYLPNIKTLVVDDLNHFHISNSYRKDSSTGKYICYSSWNIEDLILNPQTNIENTLRGRSFIQSGWFLDSQVQRITHIKNLHINSMCKYIEPCSEMYFYDYTHGSVPKIFENIYFDGTFENFSKLQIHPNVKNKEAGLSKFGKYVYVGNENLFEQDSLNIHFYGIDNFNSLYYCDGGENNIENLFIDEGFTEINLSNYKSLLSVEIPTTVTDCYFSGCRSMVSVDFKGKNITEFRDYCFRNCKSLRQITIPEGVEKIGYNCFENCSSLQSITIPSSVTSIRSHAFENCSSLKSITIPSNVTSIDSCAFSGCSSLESITIPSSVTSIGSSAFSGCSSLKSITISSSVTSIDSCAFYGCSSLESITIPSSVTSIGSSAFYGCSSLQSITIPSSVISIGYTVFSGCSSLTIYCEADSQPNDWPSSWNNGIPVVWGYKQN